MIRASVRRLGQALLHTGDTPERTALAFSLGVLIGFSPLLGIQTPVVLLIAVTCRLNRLAMLAGAYANLPWVIAPYYALMTAAGAWVLGETPPPDLGARIDALMGLPGWRDQVAGIASLVRPFFWSYALGSALGCTVLAAASYPPSLAFIRRRRRRAADSPDFRLPG